MPRKVEMPKGPIGPKLTKKVVPWVEVFWHSHKRYPTDTELATEFGFSAEDLMRLKASKFYNNCLKARGIRSTQDFFSEKQVAAIAVIVNWTDARPISAKLAGIGVTQEMYNGWMQDQAFKRELQSRADEILDNVYPEAQAQLAKQISRGSFPALKFWYEITGRASSPEAINVKMTMARLIEAVQKHVKDPEVLRAIAMEIEAVGPVADVPVTPIPAISRPVTAKERFANHLEEVNGIGN